MALSREEQQRLEELEALLAQDDPKLAHTLRGTRPSAVSGKRIAVSATGFVLGIGLLVAGMQLHWSVSVVGFLVMLASAAWLITGRTSREEELRRPVEASTSAGARGGQGTRPRAPRPQRDQTPFMDKLEDRWRRRQQGGR